MDAGARPRARDYHRSDQRPEVEAVDSKVRIMVSPFQTARQSPRWSTLGIILGGAYMLLLCVFAGIGFGMIVGRRGMTSKEYAECGRLGGGKLSTEQSGRFESGAVKVRAAHRCAASGTLIQRHFRARHHPGEIYQLVIGT